MGVLQSSSVMSLLITFPLLLSIVVQFHNAGAEGFQSAPHDLSPGDLGPSHLRPISWGMKMPNGKPKSNEILKPNGTPKSNGMPKSDGMPIPNGMPIYHEYVHDYGHGLPITHGRGYGHRYYNPYIHHPTHPEHVGLSPAWKGPDGRNYCCCKDNCFWSGNPCPYGC